MTDEKGRFDVLGLAVPGRYRLWAFADLNQNRSFEPGVDVLTAADTTFDLTAERPVASGLHLLVVNPRAPAQVTGTILDSLADSLGVLRVLAISESDSVKRIQVDGADQGAFELMLEAGDWRIIAYRDLDKSRTWKPSEEPASAPLRVTVTPAEVVKDLVLVLERSRGVPSPR
jgi:hypothetical protein